MVDIATLGIEVRSESLLRASANLDKFAGVTQRVEQRMQGFSTGVTKMQGSVNNLAGSIQGTNRVMNGFTNVLQALGVSLAVKEVAGFADIWSDLNSRVRIAAGGIEQGTEVMERLSDMARRTYSSLEATTETYIRNATVMRELGYTTNQTLDYVESINNALVVSGAKGDRAAGVMNALSNAMMLGALRGQDLDNVLKNGGRVAEALAASMGVTTNELKQLGAQGKITSADVFKITNELEKLRDEADGMPATIGDSFVIMRNSALKYIGVLDQSGKVSENFAKGIVYLADHIEILGNGMLLVGGIAGAKFLGPMIASMGKATISTSAMTVAMIKGNAVMLDGRTAALQKANYIRQAALADQQAAKAALDAANAEQARAVASLEAAKAGQLVGISHKQAAAQVVAANRAVSASQVDLAAKTAIANRTLIQQEAAALKAGKAARTMSIGAMLGRGALSLAGGPVGAAILGITAVGTAVYSMSQQAEEARLKSAELQKTWLEMGYDAPLTAGNIEKISEAIAKMAPDDVAKRLKEIKSGINEITKESDQSFSLSKMLGIDTDGDLEKFSKSIGGLYGPPSADKDVRVFLKETSQLLQKVPTEAYRVEESLKEMLNRKDLNSGTIVLIGELLKKVQALKAGLNEDTILGGNLGIEQASKQFDTLRQYIEEAAAVMQGELKTSTLGLIDDFQKGDISAEQFVTQLKAMTGGDIKFDGLIKKVLAIATAIGNARGEAKGLNNDLSGLADGVGSDLDTDKAAALRLQKMDDYVKKQKEFNSLSKEERDLRRETASVMQKSVSDGTGLDEAHAKELAKDNLRVKALDSTTKSMEKQSNAYKDLIQRAEDRVDQIKLEAQTAGLNGIAADTMMLKLELEQKAREKTKTITAAQREEIEKLVASYQKAAEASAKAALQADLYNERQMIGLSSIEQAVASRMQNAGLIYGSDPQMEAAIRYNEQLKIGMGLTNSFFSTFINDMVNGKNAADAVGNAIKNIGNQLIDMATQQLVAQAFGPLLGGGGRSSGGLFGGIFGGLFGGGGGSLFSRYGGLTGLFADGAAFGQNARMFAKGGMFTNSIFNNPTAFRFADGGGFSNGIMGEAGPEAVMPLKRDARGALGVAVNGWGSGKGNSGGNGQTVKVDVGVSVDETGTLKAYIKNVSQETTQQGIKDYDSSLPDTIGQKIAVAQKKNRMG